LRIYLDTSVIVPLLTTDSLSARANLFMVNSRPTLLLSDFACAEFASTIARKLRNREMSGKLAKDVFAKFDSWSSRETNSVSLQTNDIADAIGFIRRLDLTLRAPDALHIAMARRLGAALVTFDAKMAASGRALGVEIAEA
jgi:predicted nucleic acid-binding protein